jgi:hypothetical protein
MAYPIYDSFSLQDSNFVTTDIEYRTIPSREISLEAISRKPGKKFVSTEFGERKIRLSGFILGSSATDLQTNIDNFHQNVTRKSTGVLSFDATRSINATVSVVSITDPQYSQTMVPFEVEFTAASPFYEGTQQTAVTSVAEGTSSKTISTTISGSVFAEPTITYYSAGIPGQSTTIYKMTVTYSPTSEYVTWSGGDNTLARGDMVQFDYANQRILEGSTDIQAEGAFSRFEPGSTNIVVDFYSTSTSSTTKSTSTTATTLSTSTTHTGTTTSTSTTRSTSTTTTLASPRIEIVYKPRFL